MKATPTFALLLLASSAAHASPRTSADYSITTETTDAGGRHTTSADYAGDSSAGGVAGLSTAASPTATAKHGYIGQLYEITALQLGASQRLDDDSILNVPAASVSWSVLSGPVASIDNSGLATASVVAQDMAASVQGALSGLTGTLNLTVLDSLPDNFGTYAADGLGDDWQVQYFGLSNPNAAPQLDPDFDGHTNLFEYIAGLDPTSAASYFRVTQSSLSGGAFNVTFPTVLGRSYQLQSSPNLTAPWTDVGTAAAGTGGTVTLPVSIGTETRHFYHVSVGDP